LRAIDISIFLIALQASLKFVAILGIFSTSYYAGPANHWTEQSISNLSDYSVNATSATMELSLFQEASMAIEFLYDSLFFMIEILLSVIVIFPTLVRTFHIPIEVSGFLQTFVWFMYYLGYRQWKSGKSVDQFK
jgi:hypothetical protein